MAKFFNVSAHALATEQLEDIMKSFGISENSIVDIKVGNVDPHVDTDELASVSTSLVDSWGVKEGDVAMVAGEPIMSVCLVRALQSKGVTCVSATTERMSVEKVLEDGTVQKTNQFKHVRFREWPSLI